MTIHVQTGATIGPKGLPLVYGNPDSLTILNAVINFETSHDCKAKGVEILFKAAIRTQFSGIHNTHTHTHMRDYFTVFCFWVVLLRVETYSDN